VLDLTTVDLLTCLTTLTCDDGNKLTIVGVGGLGKVDGIVDKTTGGGVGLGG
jgi:hypothetical protein